PQGGHLDQILGPRTENTRDQVALVIFRHTHDGIQTTRGVQDLGCRSSVSAREHSGPKTNHFVLLEPPMSKKPPNWSTFRWEAGLNMFDSADVYSNGAAEEVLG